MAKKRAHRPQGSSPTPAPRPSPSPNASATPPAKSTRSTQPAATMMRSSSPARLRFEELSRPMLLRMQALPTFVVPVLMGVLMFIGLVLPYWWAGLALLLIAAFLTWLTAVSWPAISPASRILRSLINVFIAVLGVIRVFELF